MKYNYCIGSFDGVHLGHQQLIKKVIELSGKNTVPGAITFDPSIKEYFAKDGSFKPLTTTEQKKELMYSYGLEDVLIIPFDTTIEHMAANDFIKYILNNLDIENLVCGFDFTFGYRGEGTVQTLLESKVRNFNVIVCDEFKIDDKKVSSNLIRSLVLDGNINKANELLGHLYKVNTGANLLPNKGNFEIELKGQSLTADSDKLHWYKNKDLTIIREL